MASRTYANSSISCQASNDHTELIADLLANGVDAAHVDELATELATYAQEWDTAVHVDQVELIAYAQHWNVAAAAAGNAAARRELEAVHA